MVNPLLTNVSCINQPLDHIERETHGFYASFAITITMSKKAKQTDGDIDSFLGQSFKKTVCKNNFSEQFRKLINRYKRIGYSLDIMRQTACLVVNPIIVDGYASLLIARRRFGRQTQ